MLRILRLFALFRWDLKTVTLLLHGNESLLMLAIKQAKKKKTKTKIKQITKKYYYS